MYKGPMDKAEGEKDWGWEVGLGGVGESVTGKWRQLYLNKNLKKQKEINKSFVNILILLKFLQAFKEKEVTKKQYFW